MLVSGEGPSGYLHPGKAVPYTTAISTEPGPQSSFGFKLANELAVRQGRAVLNKSRGAGYLHVDDILVITDSKSIVKADDLMNLFADTCQEGGLEVPPHERVRTCQLEKGSWL